VRGHQGPFWYNTPAMALTRIQLEALKLLAHAGEGSPLPALVRRGVPPEELHRLVRSGLVRAERIHAQDKPPSRADFHIRISDTGRTALAQHGERAAPRKVSMRLLLIALFVLALLAGMFAGKFIVPHA
jgi:hypothetical protein